MNPPVEVLPHRNRKGFIDYARAFICKIVASICCTVLVQIHLSP
jgi:hypothetical protein